LRGYRKLFSEKPCVRAWPRKVGEAAGAGGKEWGARGRFLVAGGGVKSRGSVRKVVRFRIGFRERGKEGVETFTGQSSQKKKSIKS